MANSSQPVGPDLVQMLEQIMGATAAAPDGRMGETLRQLDAHLQAHREQLDPRLVHYLERRSYVKALQWLRDQKPASDE